MKLRWLCPLLLLMAAPAAQAGNFGVSPIRLDFDARSRTGAITVSNDGDSPLSFQMRLMEWTQDGDGKDVYADSNDLIFYPRIVKVAGGDKGLIRVGTKSPPGTVERSYRLFIEELPDARVPGQGAQVQVKLRFGVPIFAAPAQPVLSGDLEALVLDAGQLHLKVRNTGNRQFRFDKLQVRAGDVLLGEKEGWYLLAGAARAYSVPLNTEACLRAKALDVSLKAESLELKQTLPITAERCRRP